LVSLTLSYHPESADPNLFLAAVEMARAFKQPVSVNVVDAGANGPAARHVREWCRVNGVGFNLSPYERMDTLAQIMPTGLCCKGGEQHLTVTPDGSAWPCLTTLRSPYWKERCLGNWLDGTLDMGRKPQPCYLNCVDHYIMPTQHSAGDMWCLEAKPCEHS